MRTQEGSGFVTRDEYLASEACAETRREYVAGTLRAMAGATPEHVAICFNLGREIGIKIRGTVCRGGGSDQRVWIAACDRYYYPDLTITCGERHYEVRQGLRSLINPTVIFEVLSAGTEQIDRGEKFLCCQEIESLSAYVLVSQDAARIEIFTRGEGGDWRYKVVTGLDAEFALPAPDFTLRLADIYEDVEFAPTYFSSSAGPRQTLPPNVVT